MLDTKSGIVRPSYWNCVMLSSDEVGSLLDVGFRILIAGIVIVCSVSFIMGLVLGSPL